MPVGINYTFNFGSKFGCKLGLGIAPLLFINYKQDQEWDTTEGSNGSNSIKTNVGLIVLFSILALIYILFIDCLVILDYLWGLNIDTN